MCAKKKKIVSQSTWNTLIKLSTVTRSETPSLGLFVGFILWLFLQPQFTEESAAAKAISSATPSAASHHWASLAVHFSLM